MKIYNESGEHVATVKDGERVHIKEDPSVRRDKISPKSKKDIAEDIVGGKLEKAVRELYHVVSGNTPEETLQEFENEELK